MARLLHSSGTLSAAHATNARRRGVTPGAPAPRTLCRSSPPSQQQQVQRTSSTQEDEPAYNYSDGVNQVGGLCTGSEVARLAVTWDN